MEPDRPKVRFQSNLVLTIGHLFPPSVPNPQIDPSLVLIPSLVMEQSSKIESASKIGAYQRNKYSLICLPIYLVTFYRTINEIYFHVNREKRGAGGVKY